MHWGKNTCKICANARVTMREGKLYLRSYVSNTIQNSPRICRLAIGLRNGKRVFQLNKLGLASFACGLLRAWRLATELEGMHTTRPGNGLCFFMTSKLIRNLIVGSRCRRVIHGHDPLSTTPLSRLAHSSAIGSRCPNTIKCCIFVENPVHTTPQNAWKQSCSLCSSNNTVCYRSKTKQCGARRTT